MAALHMMSPFEKNAGKKSRTLEGVRLFWVIYFRSIAGRKTKKYVKTNTQ